MEKHQTQLPPRAATSTTSLPCSLSLLLSTYSFTSLAKMGNKLSKVLTTLSSHQITMTCYFFYPKTKHNLARFNLRREQDEIFYWQSNGKSVFARLVQKRRACLS